MPGSSSPLTARDRALLADDTNEIVKTVKSWKFPVRRPFTMDDIHTVLEHCNAEWHSMVISCLYTGQRPGDIARFPWRKVHLKRKTISLVR